MTSLSLVGGFGKDPWNASDMEMEQAFLSGNAAMRFDTVDLAARIPTDRQDRVKVIMLPGMDGQSRAQLPGTPGYGISITRSCLESDRRDTALEFVAEMLAAPFGSQGAGLMGSIYLSDKSNSVGLFLVEHYMIEILKISVHGLNR